MVNRIFHQVSLKHRSLGPLQLLFCQESSYLGPPHFLKDYVQILPLQKTLLRSLTPNSLYLAYLAFASYYHHLINVGVCVSPL